MGTNAEQRIAPPLFDRVERATEVPMLILSVAFLLAVGTPEVVELPEAWQIAFEDITWIVWGAFGFELLVKTYLAPDRRRYVVTHWMDVICVLVPFLRPLLVLRVVVVGIRFWTEARTVLRERTYSFIGTASLLAVGAAAGMVYAFERGGDGPIQSFSDALWWAAVTITTVGYGDMYPKTPAGRGVAVCLMLIGISLFGVLTARVAAFFVESERQPPPSPERLDEVLRRLERIESALAQRREGPTPSE